MSGKSVWNVLNELVQGFLLDMPRSPSLEPAWSQTHGLGKVGGLVARCRTMPGPRIS